MRRAAAVVIGGGIIGTSIAFNLSRLGMRDVLLLEREWLGSQATGQSGALLRTHYTNAPEARLAQAGLHWFEHWADLVGGSCGFVQTGFLQICAADDASRFHENLVMLQGLGIDTDLVDQAALTALQPGLVLGEQEVAAYEPRSGYANPLLTIQSLAAAARRGGAELCEQIAVHSLRVSGSQIQGVDTSAGPIDAPLVILANGGWASALVQPLGIDLPMRPVLSQIAIFQRPDEFPAGPGGHLTLIDRARGYYARPDGDEHTLVGLSGLSRDLEHYDQGVKTYDFELPGKARKGIASRMASFAQAKFVRKRSGPLDVTPDRGAIIGGTALDGLYVAVGMSGSGFKKAPAIGACIAELIIHGQAITAPIAPFRLARFLEQDLIQGNDYLPLSDRSAVTPH